ncbi:MAG: FADH(2)-oxidizing methylenetetrahydrofolate--tRNA-(uracil(54)-C(5))-methyltransferase TrmFO [Selenomonadales bacterium]|nr:FADH(2)-oxidizing methylenetetrahydrofolate--tRNA-(uracil(54)-C(5))-methyltransferase TrmFO [Selenomonadales bacterium]
MEKVVVIGAGLAGSEAAWQLANQGVQVTLYEMRPKQKSPAHHTDHFAELVCSNSLRGAGLENAVGLLKEEMRRLGSLIMEAADACAVPAGGALAVDREAFGQYITNKVKTHPNIEVIENTEITELNFDEITIVATGPLTSGKLAEEIASLTGENYCYFYDAAAPIVTGESLDWNKVYRASRYGKGDADYVNCPFNEEEYKAFWEALTTAEEAPTKDFEKQIFFEGCMPIEVMAKRGIDTMRYGPMKPVGLDHPETGAKAYAVVQLRQDNAAATLYNIVGFQTHLKWPEQQRVFRMIPGLENAEFVRLGVMHRNTYIHSPKVLEQTLQLKGRPRLFFAGQITGVEGYVESAASGLMAGINAARLARGEEPLIFPEDTAHGALSHYITHAEGKNFQPMNVNFGLLPPLGQKIRDKKAKNKMIAERALESLKKFKVFRQ